MTHTHTNEMVGRHWSTSLSEYVEENFLLKKSDSDTLQKFSLHRRGRWAWDQDLAE